MCKYCKNYFTGDDFYPIDSQKIDIAENIVKLEIDTYITRLFTDGKAVLATSNCYSADNYELESYSKYIPIKYCPFCGKELKENA